MDIQDDFRVYPWSKVIRFIGANANVHSLIDFHSWIMSVFDEPGMKSYEIPIKFITSTSFSMINGWFLDNGDGSEALQHLFGGSINTIDYTTVSDPVYMLDVDTEVAAFVAGDLDKLLTDDATEVGPILAFKANYPSASTARVWLRDTRGTPATIAANSVIAVTGGTGSYTNSGGPASVNGDEIYTNLFTLASFPGTPNPQVYIYQEHPVSVGVRIRIAEWSTYTNWDRGTIDILISTQLGGTEIDGAKVTALVRQPGDSFTFVEVDLSGGARTPISTETLDDSVNVTKGEHYLLYDGSGAGQFSVGDIVQDVSSASVTPPQWYFEVVSVTEFSGNTEGVITLRGLRELTAIADNDGMFVGTVQEGTANGAPGDTFTTYVAETTPPTALGTLMEGGTSGARRLLRGVQDDGTTGALVFGVDEAILGALRNPYYRDFAASEDITEQATPANLYTNAAAVSTTVISGYSDITVAHINGRVTTSGGSPSGMLVGEVVTWNTGSDSAIFAGWVTEFTEMMLANVTTEPDAADSFIGAISGATVDCDSAMTDDNTMSYNFPQVASNDYSVLIQCGDIYESGRGLGDVYMYLQYYVRDGQDVSQRVIFTSDGSSITQVAAEEYLRADPSYNFTKPAPYGIIAGGTWFTAQGVWGEGMAQADENKIKVRDVGNLLIEPLLSIVLTVDNTRISDVIDVFLELGTTGLPDKAQFTGHATNNAVSDSTFELDTSLPTDTPSSGVVFVVALDELEEHRYRFTSWTGAIVTLAAELTGIAEAGSANQQLVDTGVFASGAQRGDIIRNTTDPSWGYLVSVDDDDTVQTTQMRDSTGVVVPWAVADAFEINSLIQNYNGADLAFIPYADGIEDTGTEGSPGTLTQSILFLGNRNVVIVASNMLSSVEIVPFKGGNQITNTGMNQAIIRTEDKVTT